MEENLRAIPRNTLKTKTWRMFSAERAEKAFDHDFDNTVFRDHFVLAQEQARSTGVFDEKYSDLMAIAQTYQESILQPVSTFVYIISGKFSDLFIHRTNLWKLLAGF